MRLLPITVVALFSLGSVSVRCGPYDPNLANEIDTYLAAKNSPLAGYGAVFVTTGLKYNVDPRLIVAISGAESSFGTQWAACLASGYNAWSWFYNRIDCAGSPFSSFTDGISEVTRGIALNYLPTLTTIPEIGVRYCGSGCESWVPNVTKFYTDLGGDLNDLTYSVPSAIILQPGPDTGEDIWTTSVYSYAACSSPGPGGGEYNDQLRVGGWGDWYYALLRFNLSGLPIQASSVSLQLFCYSANGATTTPLFLDRIQDFWWDWQTTGTGCDNNRLWWTDRPPAVQWNQGVIPSPVIGQWYSIDITDLYNAWQSGEFPNYGLQLRPLGNWDNFDQFYSSRYADDPNLRPKLVIEP